MNNLEKNTIFSKIIEKIDIPDSAYETAKNRYEDIGVWLERKESLCANYNVHIFPQGSFRFGTVIRPLDGKEEYDLDLACKLFDNFSKQKITQEELKKLVGIEIEGYRKYRGIEEEKEEKHRCWRLSYKDNLKFHIDIVPCIPEESNKVKYIKEEMIKLGSENNLADTVSKHTVAITDNRHSNYKLICDNWNISNSEGYALWFISRMKQAQVLLEDKVAFEKIAKIDELPVYQWHTPLQLCIKLFKRHRDVMFKDDPDNKPISIIITTLAAQFYNGESGIEETIGNIIAQLKKIISCNSSKILNPVNPSENFADKWSNQPNGKLLQNNFYKWVLQLDNDFKSFDNQNNKNAEFILDYAMEKYAVQLNINDIFNNTTNIGFPSIIKPKIQKIVEPASPHCY